MTTLEKVAYLRGLAEGSGVTGDTKEGKLLAAVMDILDDLASDIEDLSDDVLELSDGLDAVSDDLSDVEEVLFGDEDDDEDDEDEDDEPLFYEVTCPSCGETLTIDEDILDLEEIECPNCGELLEFDLDDIDEDEDDEPEDE